MLEYMYIWVCVHMAVYSLGNTHVGEYPCVHTVKYMYRSTHIQYLCIYVYL